MSAKGQGFDLLGAVKNAQTPFFMSLVGFRKSISKQFGVRVLPLVMHDNAKAIVRREQDAEYPYGYFKINSLIVPRDKQPNKTLRRHGSTMSLEGATNSSITKGYLFPCSINLEMHFIHNDPVEVLRFIEKAAILGATGSLSFRVDMPGSTEFRVGVSIEDGPIELPSSELESETDAAAFDIMVSFRIDTRIGVFKDVPKINNQGHVTKSTEIGDAPVYEQTDTSNKV